MGVLLLWILGVFPMLLGFEYLEQDDDMEINVLPDWAKVVLVATWPIIVGGLLLIVLTVAIFALYREWRYE